VSGDDVEYAPISQMHDRAANARVAEELLDVAHRSNERWLEAEIVRLGVRGLRCVAHERRNGAIDLDDRRRERRDLLDVHVRHFVLRQRSAPLQPVPDSGC
jgi:hypothetical protein